jgi:hypothetical protein
MVSWNTLVRGALTRFIPGVCTFLGASWIIMASRNEITVAATPIAGAASLTLWFTAGFVVTIGVLRSRLHDTAHVDGRRSFIAGFSAVPVLLAAQVLSTQILYGSHMPRSAIAALAMVAGAIATFAVFFPRLRSRMAQLERAENGQLYADVVEFAERGTPRDDVSVRATRST